MTTLLESSDIGERGDERASEPDSPAARSAERSRTRRVVSTLITIAIILMAIYLWPARLGGVTRLVIVSGDSMEPTYDFGDLVVTRDVGEPAVGDTVVFEVPTGPAEGLLVIHRVLSIDADGTITTQGDNRDTPDRWPLVTDDVVGEPTLHVPKAGLLVWMVRSPFALACLLVLAAALLMWPRSVTKDDESTIDESAGVDPVDDDPVDDDVDQVDQIVDRRQPVEHELWRLEGPPLVTSAARVMVIDRHEQAHRRRRIGDTAIGVPSHVSYRFETGAPIDPDVLADAEAWVDEQLALAASR